MPVVEIDYYLVENLPDNYKKQAVKQGIKLGEGLVAVKTIIESEPRFEIIPIGKSSKSFNSFLHQIAKEDGGDLNAIAKLMKSKDPAG